VHFSSRRKRLQFSVVVRANGGRHPKPEDWHAEDHPDQEQPAAHNALLRRIGLELYKSSREIARLQHARETVLSAAAALQAHRYGREMNFIDAHGSMSI
jgi:hypothetical protein